MDAWGVGHFDFHWLTNFADISGLDLTALALAAVFRQVGQQGIHPIEMRPVNQVATDALLTDQVGVHQAFEVKGQGIGCHIHVGGQCPRGEP